ncbi:MAG TPA: DUF929 family protein [Candidatus Saccharimonadales bacterium]|nr:DUF929 family protein [Candidatus Saccharimonadales bacterium]
MAARSIRRGGAPSAKALQSLCYAAILISVMAVLASAYSLVHSGRTIYVNKTVYINNTVYSNSTNSTAPLSQFNITGSLITPLYYLPNDPVINQSAPFGKTLQGINSQLNATELSIINNASQSYFETAGMMYLNRSLANSVSATVKPVPTFLVNGKPSVIYFGSITCIFCGENRWAMALALSRFGNFSTLFNGYSSFGDYDVPTLYWSPAQYNQSSVDLGSFYNSKYINFIAIEDTDPITAGFNLQSLPVIAQEINSTGNLAYESAFQYILDINNFQGTPYTIWGGSQVSGADAIDFGNTPPTGSTLALSNMTHAQVLGQLANPDNQFSWTEYAAADLYIAMTCASINNTAPVCSLPAIIGIEKQNGY